MTFPFLIYTGHWFGALDGVAGPLLYMLPPILWAVVAASVASLETKHPYPGDIALVALGKRVGRLFPQLILNTGMLPHQASAFAEGLFGPLHSEFERTPKAASVTTRSHQGGTDAGTNATDPSRHAETSIGPPSSARRSNSVKIHWPYVLAETFLIIYQLAWTVLFAWSGLLPYALGTAYIAVCVIYLGFFYGDHAGKVCFILDGNRLRQSVRQSEG
jgi:hypothetical protein